MEEIIREIRFFQPKLPLCTKFYQNPSVPLGFDFSDCPSEFSLDIEHVIKVSILDQHFRCKIVQRKK